MKLLNLDGFRVGWFYRFKEFFRKFENKYIFLIFIFDIKEDIVEEIIMLFIDIDIKGLNISKGFNGNKEKEEFFR